jgi:L-2-hydroxyglutarate oxidase LhgO
MNKKHVIGAVLVGMALGYVLQNYIAKVPVINKLPRLGGTAA